MHPFRPHEFSLFLRDGPLHERLTFDKMLAYSEPKRIARAATVRQPTMQVETHGDGISYFFNCKSYPSTTGNRQKGYIRFFRPKNPSTPLERVECEVDCSCLDYRYRWAWAVKQRGSSRVGPTSVNKAWNKAPRITNPKAIPGLCKHLISLKESIYGAYSGWGWKTDDTTSRKLDRLVRMMDKRLIQDGKILPGGLAELPSPDKIPLGQEIRPSSLGGGKPMGGGPASIGGGSFSKDTGDVPTGEETDELPPKKGVNLGGITPTPPEEGEFGEFTGGPGEEDEEMKKKPEARRPPPVPLPPKRGPASKKPASESLARSVVEELLS